MYFEHCNTCISEEPLRSLNKGTKNSLNLTELNFIKENLYDFSTPHLLSILGPL